MRPDAWEPLWSLQDAKVADPPATSRGFDAVFRTCWGYLREPLAKDQSPSATVPVLPTAGSAESNPDENADFDVDANTESDANDDGHDDVDDDIDGNDDDDGDDNVDGNDDVAGDDDTVVEGVTDDDHSEGSDGGSDRASASKDIGSGSASWRSVFVLWVLERWSHRFGSRLEQLEIGGSCATILRFIDEF